MGEHMDTAVISKGMKLTGDINSEGPIQVAGSVKGNVETNDKLYVTGEVYGDCSAREARIENAAIFGNVSTSEEVEVCEGAVIIGGVSSATALISGAVQGDIDIHGDLILKESAVVLGNIKSSRITIEEGAAVSGNISQCYAGVDLKGFFASFDADAGTDTAKVKEPVREVVKAVEPPAESAKQKRAKAFETARERLLQPDATDSGFRTLSANLA